MNRMLILLAAIAALLAGSASAQNINQGIGGVYQAPTCAGDLTGTFPKCKVAKINGETPPFLDVRTYGGLTTCAGATDDSGAFNAANTAAVALGGASIYVPTGCRVGSTVTIGANVTFYGAGQNVISVTATAANMQVFNLSGNNSQLRDLEIDAGSVSNTSGCTVGIASSAGNARVQHTHVTGGFVSYCSAGIFSRIYNNYITSPVGATGTPVNTSGACIKITGGTDTYVLDNFCGGASATVQPYAAVWVTGGGGHKITGTDGLYTGNGIVIDANAVLITWIFTGNNVLDSGTGTCFLVQSAGGSGGVTGVYSTADWCASFQQDGVKTSKGAGTLLNEVMFTAPTIKSNYFNGVNFASGDNLKIDGGSVCGNSSQSSGSYDGVVVGSTTTNVTVNAVRIGNCGNTGSTQNYAVNTSTTGALTAIGNDLQTGNVHNSINYGGTPSPKNVWRNAGITDDDLAAWTAFTPTVTCLTNSLTAYTATGRYRRDLGTSKTVHVALKVTTTTVGTCATQLLVTMTGLPTSNAATSLAAAEDCNQGQTYNARLPSGATQLKVQRYDASLGVADGSCLLIGGTYEAQ